MNEFSFFQVHGFDNVGTGCDRLGQVTTCPNLMRIYTFLNFPPSNLNYLALSLQKTESMKKINRIKLSLVIILGALAFCYTGYSQSSNAKETVQKFAATLQIIDYFYVDTVDQPAIVETAIVEMLKELDPHSVYISKKDVEKANEPLVGNFEGIGVQFQIFKDTILVIAPISGGPSEKLGIMAGDKIVKIDGENATGSEIDNNFVFKRLRGKKGTKVVVSIARKNRKELLDFTIVRDKIPINSIDASFMATSDIGYIKINRFSKTTMDEFDKAISGLIENGMEKLILDLRYNSGGYLKTAVDLSDQFLDTGKLIVYTEGLKSPKYNFNATDKGAFKKGQLVVLINEGSASASEIVSGAVQDWDRGIIVGRRSFGKGLVQKPFRLPDESIIRLTTAKYYTPTGRCIQKPYEDGNEDYYKDFSRRIKHGELIHADSIDFPDSLKYFTQANRVVYGGGGIMPDVFIPFDSTRFSDYYIDLRRKNLFNSFTLQYMDNHRADLQKQYPEFSVFKEKFIFGDDQMADFVDYAEEKGVKKDEEGLDQSLVEIQHVLTALIARNLFDYNAYFDVINEIDDGFQKGIEIIQSNTLFEKLSINY